MAALNAALIIGAMIIAASSGALFLKRVVTSGLKIAFLRQSDGAAYVWAGGSGKLELETYTGPISNSDNKRTSPARFSGIKRIIDCGASISLLILFAPLLVLTAAAIKFDSPGPVLYRQKRIGFRGERIDIFKFRSMIVDAEKDGPQYAKTNDSRITRVGRWIRKTRIDEIPQTINVLRGEMSFVGPRPERPEFVAVLEKEIPHYHYRHLVKPGITGWAQVKYEYAASVEGAREKLRFDLFYIRHFTPLLDIVIILMTIRVALLGIGSR